MEETLDRLSQNLRMFVDRVGKLSTFFIIPLVFITIWDVFCRKLVWIQIWLVANFGRIFESTLLQEMDSMQKELTPLESFILPGGVAPIANLHVARSVVRRAERLLVELINEEGKDSVRFFIQEYF